KVRALGDQVDVTADVAGGAIDHTRGALDDVEAFDGVEAQRLSVGARRTQHAVLEDLGGLAAQKRHVGASELVVGVGARDDFHEVGNVDNRLVPDLRGIDFGDGARRIEHGKLEAEYGSDLTLQRADL